MSAFAKSVLVVGVMVMCAASAATAAPWLDMMVMTDAPGDVPVSWAPTGTANGDGSFSYSGYREDTDGHWTLDWACTAKEDPYISASYTLVNTFNTTLTFTLLSTLPITPAITPSSLMGGSTGGSVTDANGSGLATVSTAGGQPLFAGQIDGVTALSIYPDPNSWSAVFAGGTANIPAANVGLPGPTIPGPAALTDIGIENHFTLTPGDRVAFTAYFVVIPEPSACVLLMLGAVALIARRR